jgi:hypothetical protein
VGGKENIITCPKVTFDESQHPVVHIGRILSLAEGSVEDLVTQGNQVAPTDQVKLGCVLQAKVTGLGKDMVRVDLSLQRNQVETASKSGIVVVGSSLRAVQKAHLGKWEKVNLGKDEQGTARTRIEFKVTAGK